MPQQIPYNQALYFASLMFMHDEFVSEYGTADQWIESLVDVGELMAFVDSVFAQ